MPDFTITVSTGVVDRIRNAALAAGYPVPVDWVRELIKRGVVAYEQGNAAATAANTAAAAVITAFLSTST